MATKTTIEMAEACGIPEFENNESQAENIMRFAELVRADEREACAKVCDEADKDSDWPTAANCAAAIRARGNT